MGGLIILQHNKINKELALVPSAVCIEPMIQTRHAAKGTNALDPKSPVQSLSHSSDEELGDFLIHGYWACGMDVIVDVRMTNSDAKLYQS
jgi:hypothetical protein